MSYFGGSGGGGGGGGGGAAIATWTSGMATSANTRYFDPFVSRYATALTSLTNSTIRPSEDPTNFKCDDDSDVSTQRIQGHKRDDGGWLVMRPGRTIDRTKYKRLLDKIAPEKPGVGITAGSNVLRLDPGQEIDLEIGNVVEMAGVPVGTTITAIGSNGAKVGSTFTGSSNIFYRFGVVSVGYVPAFPSEVTGTGLGANTTATATVVDMTATFTTTLASSTISAAPGVTGANSAIAGCHIAGTGFAANARLLTFSPNVVSTANARNVIATPLIYASCDLYSQINSGMLVGRQISMTGFTGTPTITAVTDPESTLGGLWNWVTALGFFGPWDLSAGDIAKTIVHRKISGGNITDAASLHLTTINPAATRNGAVNAGAASFFWQVGQAVLTQTIERRVGNASAAIPANNYITAHTNDVTGLAADISTGSPNVFFPIGTTAAGLVGQYVNIGAGLTNARITALQIEFTSANSTTTTASNQLYIQPGVPSGQFKTGQRISGTNIPANATLTALGVDTAVPTSRVSTGATQWNVPVGFVTPVVNRKITGSGIPANTNIAGVSAAEFTTVTGQYTRGGFNLIRLLPGSGLATTWLNRFLTDSGNALPANTYISTVTTVDFTIANLRAVLGESKLFWPVGGSIVNAVSDSAFTLPLAWPTTAARLTANPVAQFTSTNSSTVNASNQLYVQPGITPANLSVGQAISGTNIPANATLLIVNPDTAVPQASFATTSTAFNLPVSSGIAPVVNQKVTATGIPANTNIAALGTETTVTVAATFNAASSLFFDIGGSTAGFSLQRYFSHPSVPGTPRLTGAVVAQSTQTNVTASTGVNTLSLPGGAAVPAGAIPGAYVQMTGVPNPARLTAVDAGFSTPQAAWVALGNTLEIPVTIYNATTMFVGRGVSGTGIPANSRILNSFPESTVPTVNVTIGSTTLTSTGQFIAGMVGQYISGLGIPPNARITGFTNSSSITISAAATGTNSNIIMTLGGRLAISTIISSTQTNVALTFTGYMTLDVIATTNSTTTLTIGASVPTSAAATATTAVGANTVLGVVHTLSANTTAALNNGTAILGAVHTMSANATAAATTTTVTFAPWATVNSAPALAQTGATATFGGIITVSASATADILGGSETFTFGPQITLSAAATASGSTSPTMGAVHTMSALATGTATTTTVSFGKWYTVDINSTATAALAATTLGAFSTMNANATANDNTPLTFGSFIVPTTLSAATIRNVTAKVGAILTVGTNATSTNAALAVTFGPIATIDIAATANGTVATQIGGYHVTDSPGATTALDQTLNFGSQVTMSASATATNDNATGRFFPFGAGNGTTTFGIGLDPQGRALGIGGSGTGLTARAIGATVGTETHTLTGTESGFPGASGNFGSTTNGNHNHAVNLGNQGGGQGTTINNDTGANGNYFTSFSGGSAIIGSNGDHNHTTTVTFGAANASGAHNNMQPTAWAGSAIAIYAGAAA